MNTLQLQEYNNGNSAIADGTTSFTYAELSLISDSYFRALIMCGYEKQDRILVMIDKDCCYVIAMIAIFKIGCIPVTTSLANIEQITSIVHIDHILTSDVICNVKRIMHDCTLPLTYHNYADTDIVYCIFTSGTSGVPKKFDVSKRMFETFMLSFDHLQVYFGQTINFLSLSAISFDPIYMEIFWTMSNRGFVYISSYNLITNAYATIINQYKINLINVTPHHMKYLYMQDQPYVGTIIFGGDTACRATSSQVIGKCDNLIQIYGLVESTIIATYKVIKSEHELSNIGKPFPNYSVYLSEDGEIIIDSICSRGIICTGDYGYYDNGDIIYCGRNVMKRLGHRLHFSDVAMDIIKQCPDIDDVVLSVSGADLNIFIITANKNKQRIIGNIRNLCANIHGDHCIPSKYYFVPNFIISTNGKVDTNAMIARCHPSGSIFEPTNLSIRENVEYWIQTIIEHLTGEYFINFALEKGMKLSSLGITSIDSIIIYDMINKKCRINFADFSNSVRVCDIIDLILSVVPETKVSIDFISEFDAEIEMDQQGLTSIDFFQLQSFLKRKYNYVLKSSKITPREIYEGISGPVSVTDHYHYIDNGSTSDIVLVFVYPISGSSVAYEALTKFMGAYDLIFLNYPDNYASIEELAAHHCGEIAGYVRDRICVLVGWSFGGILATAMADYYNRHVGIISNIIIFDSHLKFDTDDREWNSFIRDFNEKIPHLNLDYIHAIIRNLMDIGSRYVVPDYRGRFLYFQCVEGDDDWLASFPNASHMRCCINAAHHNIFAPEHVAAMVVHVETFLQNINCSKNISFDDINGQSLCIFDVDGTLTRSDDRTNVEINSKMLAMLLSIENVIISSAHPDFMQTIELLKHIGLGSYVEEAVETFSDGDYEVKKCGRCISVKMRGHVSEYFLAKIAAIRYVESCNVVTLCDDNVDVINYNRQLAVCFPDVNIMFCHI